MADLPQASILTLGVAAEAEAESAVSVVELRRYLGARVGLCSISLVRAKILSISYIILGAQVLHQHVLQRVLFRIRRRRLVRELHGRTYLRRIS